MSVRLEIERLGVKRGGRTVIADFALTVKPGEIVGLVGKNGCGKTTLLSCIAGFMPVSSGEILLDGKPVTGPGAERGVVFQKHALMPWLSVVENVEFGLRMRGMPKPERRKIALAKLEAKLVEKAGVPKGVVNLVHGGKDAVDALLDHPDVRAISFVGSTPVARYIYSRAAANGKRVQCQGGAKNPIVVLPDADLDMTTKIVADSAFGCAGQRCLASSVVITVADAAKPFTERISEAAASRKVGYGLEAGTEMGPVISGDSRTRIEALIAQGISGGAKPVVDGRNARISGYEKGHFIRPTVLDDVDPAGELARTEVFGPVLSMMRVDSVEDAIDLVNRSAYGNMACLFTSSGAAARQFRYEARVGNVGINVGVAAPMAYFPFSGWKESFFGDLHAQGRDAIDFYTEKKIVVERWPANWSRKF